MTIRSSSFELRSLFSLHETRNRCRVRLHQSKVYQCSSKSNEHFGPWESVISLQLIDSLFPAKKSVRKKKKRIRIASSLTSTILDLPLVYTHCPQPLPSLSTQTTDTQGSRAFAHSNFLLRHNYQVGNPLRLLTTSDACIGMWDAAQMLLLLEGCGIYETLLEHSGSVMLSLIWCLICARSEEDFERFLLFCCAIFFAQERILIRASGWAQIWCANNIRLADESHTHLRDWGMMWPFR